MSLPVNKALNYQVQVAGYKLQVAKAVTVIGGSCLCRFIFHNLQGEPLFVE